MVYGLLRFARNDEKKNRHCEALKKPWQSRYGNHHTKPTPSLREFVELVAILGWNTMAINQNSSLQDFEKAVAISFILGLSLREPTPHIVIAKIEGLW